jgi:hypothetical protein
MGKLAFAVGVGVCALAFGCGLVLDINPGNPIGAEVAEAGPPVIIDSGDPSCPPGQARCDGTCVDIATTAAHCGRCGHDCVGGNCAAGACEAVQIAGGLNVPYGITAHGDFVYVTLNGSSEVVKIPKAGGAPQVIVTNAKTELPGEIANGTGPGGTFLIWIETGDDATVHTCPLPDCPTVANHSQGDFQEYLAAADGVAYYLEHYDRAAPNPDNRAIRHCKIDNCQDRGDLFGNTEDSVVGLAVHGNDFFYGLRGDDDDETATVRRRPLDGSSGPRDFATNIPTPASMTTDGTFLFAALRNGNAILKCPVATGCAATPETIFSASPRYIVTDGTNAYWTSHGPSHSILGCPSATCAADTTKTLAKDQFSPRTIAFDDKAIYWTNAIVNGQVMKVAKP